VQTRLLESERDISRRTQSHGLLLFATTALRHGGFYPPYGLKYLLRKGFDIEIESSTVENRGSVNWRKEKWRLLDALSS